LESETDLIFLTLSKFRREEKYLRENAKDNVDFSIHNTVFRSFQVLPGYNFVDGALTMARRKLAPCINVDKFGK